MPHGSHRLGFLSFPPHARRAPPASHTAAISSRHEARRTSPRTGTSFPSGRASSPPDAEAQQARRFRAAGGGAAGPRRGAKKLRSSAGPGFRCGAGANTRAPSATRPCPASRAARPRRRPASVDGSLIGPLALGGGRVVVRVGLEGVRQVLWPLLVGRCSPSRSSESGSRRAFARDDI